MTFQIAKSVIKALPRGYADAVTQFRQARLKYRFAGEVAHSAPPIIEIVMEEPADARIAGWAPAGFAA
jgi:hypothetical protein